MTVKEVLEKHNIEYITSGKDYVVHCLNPEHDDTNPSMRIDKVLGIFKCLSCGFKGNIFYLLDETYHKADLLKEQVRRQIDTLRLPELTFPKDAIAVDYDYRVSKATLQEFEAFTSAEHENRIIFPIRDIKESLVAFIGRTVVNDTKKYDIFPKHATLPMFPLAKVTPRDGRIILVEGIFDFLNLWDKGVRNAICVFGANNVSQDKIELLRLMGISGIDVLFDPDEAGLKAAETVQNLCFSIKMHNRVVKLKGNSDPGDLSQKEINSLMRSLYGKNSNNRNKT